MLRDDGVERELSVAVRTRLGWLSAVHQRPCWRRLPGNAASAKLTVVCPGFAIDCLETLEEIAIANRERFLAAGGRRFLYVPALNARLEHARALGDLIAQHCQGWTQFERGLFPAGAARDASA
jgi:ferrochelatase